MSSFYPQDTKTDSRKNFHDSGVVGRTKLTESSLSNGFNLTVIPKRLAAKIQD